jgi:predicted acyl esterase
MTAKAGWQPDPARYGIVEESNVPVTMSDGTVLEADIYRPADPATGRASPGRFPVLLAQTPYGKDGATTLGSGQYGGDGYYPYLTKRGYISAVVDVRGTGSSGGTWNDFGAREREDGVQLAHWAAGLPGSTGKVGLAGGSYLGINQLYTAALVGPNSPVKAIFPVVASHDLYRDVALSGGLYDDEFLLPWLIGDRLPIDLLPDATNPQQVITAEMQHSGNVVSTYLPLIEQGIAGGPLEYDGSYWTSRSPESFLPRIVRNHIPAFLVGGWFDLFQRGEPLNYAELQNVYDGRPAGAPMVPGQNVTGRYQLVMGPWYHLTAFLGVRITQTSSPLHLYELGADKWVSTADYPLAQPAVQRLYMRGGRTGTAPQSLNDGYLLPSKPASVAASDPIPWTGASSPCDRQAEQWSAGVAAAARYEAGIPASADRCAGDDRSLQAGALTYTTRPLTHAETLAGPIDVSLNAGATTTGTEFVATVEDISPDGTSYPLTAGQLLGVYRARDNSRTWYANGRLLRPGHAFTQSSEQAVTPGNVERYDVQVFPTFAQIPAGHRIRVTITTSDTPHELPPTNQDPSLLGGVYKVQRTAANPSFADLPLAPSSDFPPSPVSWGGCNGGC